MTKTALNKHEIFTSRVVTLFFTCLLGLGLIWVERKAHYRMDLIFHHYTATVIPILAGILLLFYGFMVYLYLKKKGQAEEPKVFDSGFTLYLLSILLLAVVLPAFFLLWRPLQLYSTGTELAVLAFPAYFLGYIVHQKVSPAAAGLFWMTTFAAQGFYYFFITYYSGASAILASTDLMKLTPWGCLLILALLFAGLYAGWCFLAKKKSAFGTKKILPSLGMLLSLAAMLTLCINPLTNLLRTVLFWSVLGLQILFILFIVFWKKKK